MSDNIGKGDDDKESDDDISEIFESGRQFVEHKIEDFEDLCNEDETGRIKEEIEQVLKEYEFAKYNTLGRVPSFISGEDMRRILVEATTPNLRSKMFYYLFVRELEKRKKRRKRDETKKLTAIRLLEKQRERGLIAGVRTGFLGDDDKLCYGLWHNSLFSRIPENRLSVAGSDSNLKNAALFGKKLVFDFDYGDYMSPGSMRSCMEQVQVAYGLNKMRYDEPFDFWFCNFQPESKAGQVMHQSLLNLYTSSMITIKNDCFTNHFKMNQLVYLSPDAPKDLDTLYNDDVYVIGVYNDKGSKYKNLSYRKAEKLGIRSRRLPLDKYVAWKQGSKSLCINHVVNVLLEVWRRNMDWTDGLINGLPSRKLKSREDLEKEEKQRSYKSRFIY